MRTKILLRTLAINALQLYLLAESNQKKLEASEMRDVKVKGGHPYPFYHKGRW